MTNVLRNRCDELVAAMAALEELATRLGRPTSLTEPIPDHVQELGAIGLAEERVRRASIRLRFVLVAFDVEDLEADDLGRLVMEFDRQCLEARFGRSS